MVSVQVVDVFDRKLQSNGLGVCYHEQMPAFPHSNVLLISTDAVHSLLPPTLISQLEALLELNKVDQAAALAEQHREKLTRVANAIDQVEV